jgi:hypothetical protein
MKAAAERVLQRGVDQLERERVKKEGPGRSIATTVLINVPWDTLTIGWLPPGGASEKADEPPFSKS